MLEFKKEIHYSKDLEDAILGAFLIESTAFGRAYGIIEPEIFYSDENKIIFSIIKRMWENNERIDILTVVAKYCRDYQSNEINGTPVPYYVTKLTNAVVSTANLEAHCFIIKQMHIERELMKITLSGIESGIDVLKNVQSLEDKLRKLTQLSVKDDFKGIDETIAGLYEHMDNVLDKEVIGVTTGFSKLDTLTGGLMPGGLYVVAARPSVGKSAFMDAMVMGAATKGHKVAIISLEMNDNEITARLSSLTTEVEFWRIFRNRMQDEEQRSNFYTKMNDTLSRLPIKISQSGASMNDIKAKVSKLKQRNEIDILFIDYLGLIDAEGTNRNYNREQEVSKMSRGLKLLAKEFEIPNVLLCQLNRMSEQTGDKKPRLFHLRESGSIEQDADGVILLHSDFMIGTKEIDGMTTENERDVIIAKWRNGEVCEYKMGWDKQRMKFYELPQQNLIPLHQAVSNFYEKDDPGF